MRWTPPASCPPVISRLFPGHGAAQLETDSASFPYNPVCPQTWSSPWAVDENVMCEFHGLVENGTCYSGLLDEVMVQKLPTCPGPTRDRRINCYVLEVIKCSWVALLHQPHVYSSENERWVMSNSFWPRGLYSLPGSSVRGILQARLLEWVAINFSRGSSQPRDWIRVSCIAGGFFTTWATREAHVYSNCDKISLCNSFSSHQLQEWNPNVLIKAYRTLHSPRAPPASTNAMPLLFCFCLLSSSSSVSLTCCYGLNVCVLSRFICWGSNPQCGCGWRWGLSEVTGFGCHETEAQDGIGALISGWRALPWRPSG